MKPHQDDLPQKLCDMFLWYANIDAWALGLFVAPLQEYVGKEQRTAYCCGRTDAAAVNHTNSMSTANDVMNAVAIAVPEPNKSSGWWIFDGTF